MLYVRSRFRHGQPIKENNSTLKPCSRYVQHTGICSTTMCCLILTFTAVRTSNVKCIKIQLATNHHFHNLILTTKHCNKSSTTRSQVCQESLEEAGVTHSPVCAYLCLRACRSTEDMSFSPQRGICMAFSVASSIFPVDYFTSVY